MIHEHDKEIDSLLRRLAKSEAASAGSPQESGHIDADEISVFAENALPEKARTRVIAHMADCVRCRSILSNVIALRGEGASESPSEEAAGAVISLEIPWFQKLFAVRNLAAALGVLVIAMAGLFAVSLFRNMGSGDTAVARMENANVAADEAAGSTAPAEPEASADDVPASEARPLPSISREEGTIAKDLSKAPEMPQKNGRRNEMAEAGDDRLQDNAGVKLDGAERLGKARPADEPQLAAAKPAPATIPAAPAPPPPPPAAGNVVNEATELSTERRADRDQVKRKRSQAMVLEEKEADSASTRQVAGKSFIKRDGVWYDRTYSGGKVTIVKRNTDQFRSLDKGLRDIAGALEGTLVVVWKSRAFRIE